jgi:hypothetical protein
MVRLRTLAACLFAAALLPVGTSAANAAPIIQSFDAGVACDFPLTYEATGGNQQVHTIPGQNGTMILAGTGTAVTFTNDSTGKTFTLRSNGAVLKTTTYPDGSTSNVGTGHYVLILFPTDVPAGPSTTLYVGRVTWTADAASNFVVTGHSGTTKDICAALA